MPTPRIVQSASKRPGGDFLTGDPAGPFLDLRVAVGDRNARRGDHIYLSLKHLASPLREIGWLTDEDAATLRAEVAEARARTEHLEAVEERYHELLTLLTPYLPVQEREVEVIREVPREMTEDEMRAYVRRHAASLIREEAKQGEEKYRATYAGHGYLSGENPKKKRVKRPDTEAPSEDKVVEGIDPVVIEEHGQEVNIDDLLAKPTKTVLAVCEGRSEEFADRVVEREFALGDIKGHPHPRKGLIEGLGYDFDGEE